MLVDSLGDLRDDWERLAPESGNVFAAWEWNELWWRHYGKGRALRIAVFGGGERVDAIVPFFEWTGRPLRILRLVGHGHGDRLGPIGAQDDADTAREALRSALDANPHDLFIGDWVAGGFGRGRVVRRTGYPILRFPDGSWETFLAGQSTRFRKSARNRSNRLERGYDVSYRSADAATLERDLDAAFRLHRARFGEHSGCLFCGAHERFQREFAALALKRGWLRLLFLELGGEPVCFEYGFYYEGAYFAYQGGRDPAWDRHSVGFVLELESIRRALEEGATEYRFLGGDEDYKYRFPIEDPGLETIAVGATRRGRAAAAALEAVLRLPGGKGALRRLGAAKA